MTPVPNATAGPGSMSGFKPLYWCRCYRYGRLMVSAMGAVPETMQWVVDFLNTHDLRTHGAGSAVLVRDRLGESLSARPWLEELGFPEPGAELTDQLPGLQATREDLRAALRGIRPLRAKWTAQIEISGREHPLIHPASQSLEAWAQAHLLEASLSPFASRLRICAAEDCLWAFYDRSKNGRARWCSAAGCGNRMKTRAYRQRRHAQAPPPSAGAAAPRRVTQRSSRFRREGDYWTIGPLRRTFRLKDSKGLAYLSRLLAEPHREFHVLDLAGSGRAAAEASEVPILDPEATRRYRTRVHDLEEEIAEAQAWNDEARAVIARDELSAIAEELAHSTGLSGRSRSFSSDSERARVSVTRVIKAALSRIGEESPELKHHFASTVRTGTYCSYNPDPRLPILWEL